ncbi:MAG TPA: GH116 family glycosyl hydrolase [Ruminiclostridium sp.]
MDEFLWEGEYYLQKIDDINKYRYQYGTGCLSDQLLGQLLSHIVDLGYILPKEHVKKTVSSIYKYNFKKNFENQQNKVIH